MATGCHVRRYKSILLTRTVARNWKLLRGDVRTNTERLLNVLCCFSVCPLLPTGLVNHLHSAGRRCLSAVSIWQFSVRCIYSYNTTRRSNKFTASAVFAVVVCPSVRLSVRLPHAGLVPRLNVGSRKQRGTFAQGLSFSDARNLGKIPTRSPQTGASNRCQVSSDGDFRPISRYISETVLDRDRVTLERLSYVLHRLVLFLVTLSDSNYPKPPHLGILYRLSDLRSQLR